MTTYEVVKAGAGHAIGELLTESDFKDARRLERMVRQRYVRVVVDVEPTAAMLLEATVHQLRTIVPDVMDAQVLEDARLQEERTTARALYEARLQEIEDAEQTD